MNVSSVGGGARWSVPEAGAIGPLELKVGNTVVGKSIICKNVTGEDKPLHEKMGFTRRITVGEGDTAKEVRVWARSIGFLTPRENIHSGESVTRSSIEAKMKTWENTAKVHGEVILKELKTAGVEVNGSILQQLIDDFDQLGKETGGHFLEKNGRVAERHGCNRSSFIEVKDKIICLIKDLNGDLGLLVRDNPFKDYESDTSKFFCTKDSCRAAIDYWIKNTKKDAVNEPNSITLIDRNRNNEKWTFSMSPKKSPP